MTNKQIDRIKEKIDGMRQTLLEGKRKSVVYDDRQGFRYLLLRYYIKINDYKGGLKYVRWYDRNFGDDISFPDFLFERIIIYFKTGKYGEARRTVVKALFSNTYLFNKFFGRPLVRVEKCEDYQLGGCRYAETLVYKHDQPDLVDFAKWLDNNISTRAFQKLTNEYVYINTRLFTTGMALEIREDLHSRLFELENIIEDPPRRRVRH